ncbi:MAG: hypothetical protein OXD36_14105 [Rhodobacter sp.]|nr:hypothetical protein [Rhodobacter sp.]
MRVSKLLMPAVTLAGALALAGCGGGSDNAGSGGGGGENPPPATMPTPTEKAVSDAKAAVDGIDADSTEAAVMAAQEEIDTARAIIARQGDISQSVAQAAYDELDGFEDTLDSADRIAVINAIAAANAEEGSAAERDSAIKLAEAAIGALPEAARMAYDDQLAGARTDQQTAKIAEDNMATEARRTTQRAAITSSVTTATAAINAIRDDSSDATVSQAEAALAAIQTAIDGADDLDSADPVISTAKGQITTLTAQLGTAKTTRMAAIELRKRQAHSRAATFHNALAGYGLFTTISDGTAETFANADGVQARQGGFSSALAANRYERPVKAPGGAFNVVYSGVTPASAGTQSGYYPVGTAGNTELAPYDDNANGRNRLAVSSAFATVGTNSHTRTITEGPAGSERSVFQTKGSYRGVEGTFRCVGDQGGDEPCQSSVNGSGVLALTGPTSAGNGWFFKPDSPTAQVMDRARWGWWFTEDRGGQVDNVGVFYESNDGPQRLVNSTGLGTLGGSATYKGDAEGVFAIHGLESDSGRSGDFEADVTLNATFGSSARLTGTVDNFTGEGTDPDWAVRLNRLNAATPQVSFNNLAADGVAKGHTQWVRGSDTQSTINGQWEARMYNGTATAAPSAVLGGFTAAHDAGGRMIGAFGACRTTDCPE